MVYNMIQRFKDTNDLGIGWLNDFLQQFPLGLSQDFSCMIGHRDHKTKHLSTQRRVGDFWETKEAYILELDIPGFDKDEIDIEVVPDSFTVSGQQKEQREGEEKQVFIIRKDRRNSRFSQKYMFKVPVDTETAKAIINNGVLHFEVSKTEKSQTRKVHIE